MKARVDAAKFISASAPSSAQGQGLSLLDLIAIIHPEARPIGETNGRRPDPGDRDESTPPLWGRL